MSKTISSPRLENLPLWRLLVALADAERAFGATDPRTKQFADAVRARLAETERRTEADRG